MKSIYAKIILIQAMKIITYIDYNFLKFHGVRGKMELYKIL